MFSSLLENVFKRLKAIGRGSEDERLQDWMRVITWAVLVGCVLVGLYGASASPTNAVAQRVIAGGLMLALATGFVGGLIGFLFGIPRTLQDPAAAAAASTLTSNGQSQASPAARYAANTNLEQISDWLTKMLVGVGLTQLRDAPDRLSEAAAFFAPTLSAQVHGKPFALALIIFFSTIGFLFAYLWTRLYLARAMQMADMASQVKKELEERDLIDARALSMTRQQLDPPRDAPAVDVDQLKKAIKGATPAVKVQIFYLAAGQRRSNWKANKEVMERTIPIFEALVESDTEKRFHKNFGQLGYALKDKRQPDWSGAERNLTEAMRIRGPWREEGWVIYEFNRAVCRIMQDAEYLAKAATSPAAREQILEDLTALAGSDLRGFLEQEPIAAWMKLNKLTVADLQQQADTAKPDQ